MNAYSLSKRKKKKKPQKIPKKLFQDKTYFTTSEKIQLGS